MKHEIGSEFWAERHRKTKSFEETEDFEKTESFEETKPDVGCRRFLCGRTALDHIIKDAKEATGFESVVLPSYCCHTMIEPFIRNKIKVRFYSVTAGEMGIEYCLPEPEQEEALYLMPYFGFGKVSDYDQDLVQKWKFSILDETHSCFSQEEIDYESFQILYAYASYRKWTNIRGYAAAGRIGGEFQIPYQEKHHSRYLSLREEACRKKQIYLETGRGKKQEFLELYQKSEHLLETEYEGYTAYEEGVWDYEALDQETVRKKRRENGEYLLESLREVRGIQMLYPSLEKGCPLFVPILVEKGRRNALQKYLIKKEIYCPVHWPVSSCHRLEREAEKELYERELSLVCDQRYGIEEMEQIRESILEFFSL